jgi:signal transduction histidine kinase
MSLPEVRIAVIYVLLASVWIIGSDALLHETVEGDSTSLFLQSFKGLNFVITTGLLLYLVLRRAYGGWRKSEELRMDSMRSARERFRNLSTRIQTLREEERTRISREIHDELGQLLTGIKMQLRLLENHLADREDRSLNPLIDDLVETTAMIDDTIDSVRRIASGLRPLALDDLGLAAALTEEAEQFARRTGIECRMVAGDTVESLPPEVETAAFRIFQECLTNVARHANARRIDAEYSVANNVLVMKVRDDGVGIDPTVTANPASLGLVGMLERAADAGGKLEITSSPGEGTQVSLAVPLAGGMNHRNGSAP